MKIIQVFHHNCVSKVIKKKLYTQYKMQRTIVYVLILIRFRTFFITYFAGDDVQKTNIDIYLSAAISSEL